MKTAGGQFGVGHGRQHHVTEEQQPGEAAQRLEQIGEKGHVVINRKCRHAEPDRAGNRGKLEGIFPRPPLLSGQQHQRKDQEQEGPGGETDDAGVNHECLPPAVRVLGEK